MVSNQVNFGLKIDWILVQVSSTFVQIDFRSRDVWPNKIILQRKTTLEEKVRIVFCLFLVNLTWIQIRSTYFIYEFMFRFKSFSSTFEFKYALLCLLVE